MLVVAGLLLWAHSFAQNPCQEYERNLELYFQAYQPGEQPAITWLDQAWRNCRQPSLRFELLYHYFKAMESLYAQSGVTEVGYRMASFHHERISQKLTYLQNSRGTRDNFTVLYSRRSEALGKTLQAQAQVLDAARRLPEPTAEEAYTWAKETPTFTPSTSETYSPNRRQASTEPTFNKRYPLNGTYQDRDPWQASRRGESWRRTEEDNPYREKYGLVGNLRQLSMRDYLTYRGESRGMAYHQPETSSASSGDLMGQPRGMGQSRSMNVDRVSRSTPRDEVLTYASPTTGNTRSLVRNAPGAWVNRLGGAYQPAANLYAPLTVRDQPSFTGATVEKIEFGEIVALDGSSQTVMAVGMPFVHIRTRNGKEGWVEKLALIEGGRMAVTTQAVQGFSKPESGSRRLGLEAAEPVVLAETQGNWVKVFNLNGEKEIWLPSINTLSIEPIDLALAEGILEAEKMPTADRSRAILLDLRKLPGYGNSALRPLVEQKLR